MVLADEVLCRAEPATTSIMAARSPALARASA
jgi:hypothetical protein